MKRSFCWLCHQQFEPDSYRRFDPEWYQAGTGGEIVKFRDFTPYHVEVDQPAVVGHPVGLKWFCRKHAAAALKLTHLDSTSALAELQQQFGIFPKPEEPFERQKKDSSLWVMEVGTSWPQVFTVIRQVTGLAAKDVQTLMKSVPFEVPGILRYGLECWPRALVEAGARIEIRYD